MSPVIREGRYVRDDNQQSRQVLRNCGTLLNEYEGSLTEVYDRVADEGDLEERIDAFMESAR